MKRLPLALLLGALHAAPAAALHGQDPAPTASAPQEEAPRVFLDCNGFFCDMDFYRTEIGFVNYVRDRQDADVHVLITRQQTGGGGGEFTLAFLGLRRSEGQKQTLRHFSSPTDSQDQVRRGLAAKIKLGLIPYVAGTPAAERLRISYEAPKAQPSAGEVRDPWDYWTFRVGMRGYFNGESFQSFNDLNGSFSASRVTRAWKTRLSVNANRSESRFELPNGKTITSDRQDYGANTLMVKSLGEHLSAGVQGYANRSTFSNYDLAVRGGPAVEYNLFPYSESTRRQLTFRYSVGAAHYDYEQITIFDRMEETRLDHSLTASLDVKQRWGSAGISAEGAHLLDDPAKNRLVLFGNADLRLFKGFSLNFFGSGSRIRDQLNIQKQEGTSEEILLRQRQRLTSFRYFGSVGVSYTFGSIYNNVVNPRFDGSRGGGFVIFN
ncbi:MAG: hypothetical protein M3P24_00585 [Gemmatimonadota bacterium]|nr:hypothetical protein [Gemmatimonadota bacterium]